MSATSLSDHLLRFGHRAEHMIERGRGDGGDQRGAVAIELIVPAAGHVMAEVVPFQAHQRRTRLVGGTGLAGLGLRDPRFRKLGLRPQPPRVSFDLSGGVALVDQAARRLVTIAQCRRQQFSRENVPVGQPVMRSKPFSSQAHSA